MMAKRDRRLGENERIELGMIGMGPFGLGLLCSVYEYGLVPCIMLVLGMVAFFFYGRWVGRPGRWD